MTLKELRHYAELYGGDLARWPAPVRREALSLLDVSEEARDALAGAAALDALLDDAAPRISDRRVERVIDRVGERIDVVTPRVRSPWFMAAAPMRFWPTASLLAAMGVAGFLTVSQGVMPAQATATHDLYDVLSIGNNYLEVAR